MNEPQQRSHGASDLAGPLTVAAGHIEDVSPPGARAASARAIDEASRSVDYICSTPTLDGHDTILMQNWRLDRYLKNPVVLFCHDSRSIPIGTASLVRVENGALRARVTFALAEVSEMAEECWRAVKAGILRGISVGFHAHAYRWEMKDDKEFLVLDDLELLELSVCAVPSNPDTLAQRQARPASIGHFRDAAKVARDAARKEQPTHMNEIDTLRASVGAKDADIAALRAQLAARDTELAQARDAADKAEADLGAREAELASLKNIQTKLNDEADALKQRADKAEDALARAELVALVGRSVDPAEVDDLLAVRKASPETYQRMLARRQGRNDALTEQTIPSEAPAQRDAAANPTHAFHAALERQPTNGER